jgi:phenylalanyl-tRNA synthetase beta chain
VGEVHPETRAGFGIEAVPVFAFQLALGAIGERTPAQMKPIPRHPSSWRDVSFFVAAEVPAQRIADLLVGAREPLVESVKVLEDYRDPARVPAGKKGMLWSITYRAEDRTLTDTELDKVHEALVARLLGELGAERR